MPANWALQDAKAMSAVAFNDTIYVMGGFGPNGLTNLMEAYLPPDGIPNSIRNGKREGITPQNEILGPNETSIWDILGRISKKLKRNHDAIHVLESK